MLSLKLSRSLFRAILCFFLFIFNFLAASEVQIPYLTSECDVLSLVDGCVNAYNGKLVQMDQDIHIDGSNPLTLTRHYDGGHHFESEIGYGFGISHPAFINFFWADGNAYALVELRRGMEVLFELHKDRSKGEDCYKGKVSKKYFKSGYTNCCQALLQGEPSIYAMEVEVDYPRGAGRVKLGDGTERLYEGFYNPDTGRNSLILRLEVLPNKNVKFYDYEKVGGEFALKELKTTSGDYDDISLNSLKFHYSDDGEHASVKGSNGQKATYYVPLEWGKVTRNRRWGHTRADKVEYLLKSASVDNYPETEYEYKTHTHNRHNVFSVKQIKEPNGRILEVEFDKSMRVETLSASEHDGPLYHFDYHSDYTVVTDALGRKKKYEFDKRRLSRLIDEHRILTYHWDDKGQLTYQSLYDKESNLICRRNYTYDDKGNVLEIKLTGAITEKGVQDSARVRYTYTKDCNRIETETHNDQLQYQYSYLPRTTLLAKKLTLTDGKCVEREFHNYDKNGILVKTIVDDGEGLEKGDLTGVTYRLITEIEPQLNPKKEGMTLPETIRELYVDLASGEKQQLKRIERKYTGDLLAEEQVFDANDQFHYCKKFKYNDRRELISETNALGEKTLYEYDDSGNKISEKKQGSSKCTYFEYDAANRLIKEIEKHDQNVELYKSYEYDCLGNRIGLTDIYGKTTRFEYDHSDREICTIDPLGAKEHKEYDALGNVTKVIDKEGYTTETYYNVAGKPFLIIHPDGTSEKFIYNLQGHLIQQWFRDGSHVVHDVDYKGRITQSKTFSKEGDHLKTVSSVYKGINLISETDAMGRVTEYKYDGAGRKIAKIHEGIKTTYAYDPLSRLAQVTTGNKVEMTRYDHLDRIVAEIVQDKSGTIFEKTEYAYDLLGNQILKREFINDKETAEWRTQFNTQCLPISKKDPLGNETTWKYSQTDHLEKEERDALGGKKVEIYDALQRIKETKTLSPQGALLAQTHFTYDKRGDQIERSDAILIEGKPIGLYKVTTQYDAMRHKIEEKEQGNKTTLWEYKAGRLKTITLPNQVTITHNYDPCGRLKRQKSSDGSIHYLFTYDLCDNLVLAEDLINGTQTHRSYDAHNRLTHEKQATGFEISYTYDNLNRIKITEFETNKITHSYSPIALLSSSRYKEGKVLYTCTHTCDWRGKLLQSKLPTATLTYRWDGAGRCQSIHSPSYNQTLTYDPLGRLTKTAIEDGQGTYEESYTYDGLHQLLSEKGFFENQYTYDSIQNRRSHNQQPLKWDPLNQLTHSATSTYCYNPNGERIVKDDATYTYDALGRLLTYTVEGEQIAYTYDPLGRRIRAQTTIDTTEYHYQFDTELGAKSAQSTQFRLLQGHATAAIELDDHLYTPIRNHRGDICQLLDTLTLPVSNIRYDAFGNFTQSGITCPWLLSGQRFDPITCLYHFEKRDYDPLIGRWLTPDPLRFADGPNLYAYVHNNPLTFIDPYGLFRQELNEFADGFHRGACDELTQGLTTAYFGEYQPSTSYARAGQNIGYYTAKAIPILWPLGRVKTLATAPVTIAKNIFLAAKKAVKNNAPSSGHSIKKIDNKSSPQQTKGKSKNNLKPDLEAQGEHTVFHRDSDTGILTHYETYRPQTNPRDPKPWESVKRYDHTPWILNEGHFNKVLDKYIPEPHVHAKSTPGGVRPAEPWEIPKRPFF